MGINCTRSPAPFLVADVLILKTTLHALSHSTHTPSDSENMKAWVALVSNERFSEVSMESSFFAVGQKENVCESGSEVFIQ